MFKLDCSQTHVTFSCDYDLSPISRGCHFMGIVKTAYSGRIHTETDFPFDNSRQTDNTF